MARGETTVWVRALAAELWRSGVREVVVAPGSRSTPLVFAFHDHGGFRVRVHLDERSASFFALGVGKASGIPAAVVTTSGTAAANLFPAVVEAAQSEAPLLVLTADRPHRLRDADANQAIDQLRLFGRYVKDFFEVAPASSEPSSLRHLRGLAARAVASAIGPNAGPVHLNIPLDKPLEPQDGDIGDGAEADSGSESPAMVRIQRGRREASPEALESILDASRSGRGVIVAGPVPDPDRVGPAVRRLAAATGFPLLADPLSGGRFGPAEGAHVIEAYDLILRDEVAGRLLAPDFILRVGASPTSSPLQRWLQNHEGVRHVVVDPGSRWKDHGAVATDYIEADIADTLLVLAESWGGPVLDADWRSRWRAAEGAAVQAIASVPGGDHEGTVLAAVVASMPEASALFVSSSMPVRDLDAFGRPREAPLTVLGNRGASGIDGIVSTAFGVAATGRRTACVLGDVAFFHDQNGLLWAREADAPVVFVLIDNDGGGIFHMLPVARLDPAFTRYFATPHGLDFAHTAALHGIPLSDIPVGDVATALEAAFAQGGTQILRVRTDRIDNHAAHVAVAAAVQERVRQALGAF